MTGMAATNTKTGTIVPTEYMFSSAGIRAMENRLCGQARLGRLLELRTVEDMLANLTELGIQTVTKPDGREPDVEETLVALLKDTFQSVRRMIPYPDLIRFAQIPYDAHNVKAAIKCAMRGVNVRGMLFDCGTVSPEQIEEMIPVLMDGDMKDKEALGLLSPHIAQAATQAATTFARTRNPGMVDLILDRACYEDVAEAAATTRCTLAMNLVRCRIDTLNIMMAYRILRMKHAGREELWERTVLSGGSLDSERLHEAFLGGEDKLTAWLAHTPYEALAKEYAASGQFSALEKAADNAYIRVAKDAKAIPFGPEVVLGYVAAVEGEVKNLRIVLTGRAANLANAEIRERIRESYV